MRIRNTLLKGFISYCSKAYHFLINIDPVFPENHHLVGCLRIYLVVSILWQEWGGMGEGSSLGWQRGFRGVITQYKHLHHLFYSVLCIIPPFPIPGLSCVLLGLLSLVIYLCEHLGFNLFYSSKSVTTFLSAFHCPFLFIFFGCCSPATFFCLVLFVLVDLYFFYPLLISEVQKRDHANVCPINLLLLIFRLPFLISCGTFCSRCHNSGDLLCGFLRTNLLLLLMITFRS